MGLVRQGASLQQRLRTVFCLVVFRFEKVETHNCIAPEITCRVNSEARILGPPTTSEVKNAIVCLVKLAQLVSFPSEVECLKEGKLISSKSSILSLSPFVDEQEVLRVGERLRQSNLSVNLKHPMLPSSKHVLPRLIFVSGHLRLIHAGPQSLLSAIKVMFWPVAGRNLSRSIVKHCLTCFRFNPQIVNPIMGDLQKTRLSPGNVFEIVGVDYAGPFNKASKKGRVAKISKCYMCLFICFSTKAIHIEIVSDLTTEAFVLALRHFVLRRVVGNVNLTFEELYSLLTQIESLLNSRPLCPLTNDPNDNCPPTPAYFLVGKGFIDVPDPDGTDVTKARLSRFQMIQKIRQQF